MTTPSPRTIASKASLLSPICAEEIKERVGKCLTHLPTSEPSTRTVEELDEVLHCLQTGHDVLAEALDTVDDSTSF